MGISFHRLGFPHFRDPLFSVLASYSFPPLRRILWQHFIPSVSHPRVSDAVTPFVGYLRSHSPVGGEMVHHIHLQHDRVWSMDFLNYLSRHTLERSFGYCGYLVHTVH